ncbi:MAG: hypothetical protein MRJ92_04995 [Nitrospira sp.]|nr:hypothetical protein [Nitrospira sp.]
MDLWVREARLFKYGSGTGTNFSRDLRGDGESLSGGGRSSGLMSFLKIGDRAARGDQVGGTTRRAAGVVCLDLDHPRYRRSSSIGKSLRSKGRLRRVTIAFNAQRLNAVLRPANPRMCRGVVRELDMKKNQSLREAVTAARRDMVPWTSSRMFDYA